LDFNLFSLYTVNKDDYKCLNSQLRLDFENRSEKRENESSFKVKHNAQKRQIRKKSAHNVRPLRIRRILTTDQ